MFTLYIATGQFGFYVFSHYRECSLCWVIREGKALQRRNGVKDFYIKDATGVIVYTTEEN